MKTIVFLGSNKSGTSREALVTSREMGYYTVLITDRKDFIKQREEFPEIHELIYTEKLQERTIFLILDELTNEENLISAVISFVDPFVSLAAKISAMLGVIQISHEALLIMEDKTRFREQLKDLPVTPYYSIIDGEKPIELIIQKHKDKLPLILKSPVSNGSKDVMLTSSIPEFKESIEFFQRKFPNQTILAEEYLDGPQFLIELMVNKGKVLIVAIIEQEILHGERFIVTGYHYPVLLNQLEFDNLKTAINRIIQKLNFFHGTCHLEMRLLGNTWKLIEINPRMSGGAMNRIIQEGTGINYVKESIKFFLGEDPILEKTREHYVYAKFLTIESRGKLIKVTGKNRAWGFDGVKDVYVKPRKGAFLTAPFSLGHRYAYVIASSDSREKAIEIATKAAAEIKFYIEPL